MTTTNDELPQVVTLYEALADLSEYRKEHIDWFTNRHEAVQATKGRGWYTEYGSIRECKALVFGRRAFLLSQEAPVLLGQTELKATATSKLTPDERAALGL